MDVRNIIQHQKLATLRRDATVRDAARLMATEKIGSVLIVENDTLHGIVTERDLVFKVTAPGLDPEKTRVVEIMTPRPDTISPDEPSRGVMERMKRTGYRHLPVMEGERLAGIVSMRDILGAVVTELQHDLKDYDQLLMR